LLLYPEHLKLGCHDGLLSGNSIPFDLDDMHARSNVFKETFQDIIIKAQHRWRRSGERDTGLIRGDQFATFLQANAVVRP
jgi:hypothetical protein